MISPYVLPGIHRIIGLQFTPEIMCNHIAVKVAEYHKMTIEELKEHTRKKVVIEPRQLAMRIMLDKKISLMDIGRYFGFDHTTVIWASKRMNNLIDTEPDFADRYNILKRYVITN